MLLLLIVGGQRQEIVFLLDELALVWACYALLRHPLPHSREVAMREMDRVGARIRPWPPGYWFMSPPLIMEGCSVELTGGPGGTVGAAGNTGAVFALACVSG